MATSTQAFRSYKTELAPDAAQEVLLRKCAGNARFAYNWGLRWKMNVAEFNSLPRPSVRMPSNLELQKELDALSREKVPWVYDPSRDPPVQALKNLDRAFTNYLERRTCHPSFKSRRRGPGSFRFYGGVEVSADAVLLPGLGQVGLKERGYVPSRTAFSSATVSGRSGRWYVSLSAVGAVEPPPAAKGPLVGVDRGIGRLMVGSDGSVVENPRALRRNERKLRRLRKRVSRAQRGSKNREKAVLALERKHQQIQMTRLDAIHKATTALARTRSVIVLDNLDVRGMVKEHGIAKAVMDASMAEAARQLEYKTRWYGSKLYVAAWWYPSTKRCSGCGNVKEEMSLTQRVYRCTACGLVIDRDLNAARNLAQWPGVARTLKTPLERGRPYVEV